MQSSAPDGDLAIELEGAVVYRAQIYQASGMAAVHAGMTADEALLRMRAFAFSSGRDLNDVARDIVAGQLGLGDAT